MVNNNERFQAITDKGEALIAYQFYIGTCALVTSPVFSEIALVRTLLLSGNITHSILQKSTFTTQDSKFQ